MLIAQHLRHDRIRLEMETQPLDAEQLETLGPRATRVQKHAVLEEIAHFLETHARVGNAKRLFTDLDHRERKASTAVGSGLALPHVRTMNVKEPIVAFLRSTPGLLFDAPDGSVSHAFLVLVAPPWDDRLYLKLYKEAAEIFLRDDALPYLLRAQSETEILRFFRDPTVAAEDW
jgi:PTS system fructose-specific IIC component